MQTSALRITHVCGSGVRAHPYTHEIPKVMDKPNIERHIDLMRNQMRIQKIVIVLGYLGDSIKAYFGEGSAVSARITYVQNQHIAKRWAWSVRLAKPYFAVCKGSIILSNITDGDR